MITNKEIIAKHSRRMKNACIDLTNTDEIISFLGEEIDGYRKRINDMVDALNKKNAEIIKKDERINEIKGLLEYERAKKISYTESKLEEIKNNTLDDIFETFEKYGYEAHLNIFKSDKGDHDNENKADAGDGNNQSKKIQAANKDYVGYYAILTKYIEMIPNEDKARADISTDTDSDRCTGSYSILLP